MATATTCHCATQSRICTTCIQELERTCAAITAREVVAGMSARELDAVITGRNRLGDTQTEQLAIWNAAIDEERDR